MNNELLNRVKDVVASFAELNMDIEHLSVHDDLFALGMTSRASVSLMIGLESEFDIEFPDDMLRKKNFESIDAIRLAVQSLIATSS